jgi:hypothetical protein
LRFTRIAMGRRVMMGPSGVGSERVARIQRLADHACGWDQQAQRDESNPEALRGHDFPRLVGELVFVHGLPIDCQDRGRLSISNLLARVYRAGRLLLIMRESLVPHHCSRIPYSTLAYIGRPCQTQERFVESARWWSHLLHIRRRTPSVDHRSEILRRAQ